MRLFILGVLSLFISNVAFSQISKTSFKEPLLGCISFGGLAYMLKQPGQVVALACTGGAIALHSVERYYVNTVTDRYEREIMQLQHQLDEFVINRAVRASKGEFDSHEIINKQTIIPSRELNDGSFLLETIKIKPTLPGLGHRIGE